MSICLDSCFKFENAVDLEGKSARTTSMEIPGMFTVGLLQFNCRYIFFWYFVKRRKLSNKRHGYLRLLIVGTSRCIFHTSFPFHFHFKVMLHTIVWPHGGSLVQLAGSFTNWEPQDMKFDGATGYHTFSLDVVPGNTYQYKFIIDGKWCLDQDIPLVTAEDGHQNHQIIGEEAVIEENIDLPVYDPTTAKAAMKTPQIFMEAPTPSHIEEDHFTEWITPDDNEPASDSQEWRNKPETAVDSEGEEVEHWKGSSHHMDPDEKIDDIIVPEDRVSNTKKKAPMNWSLAGGFLVAVVAVVAYLSRQRSLELSVV